MFCSSCNTVLLKSKYQFMKKIIVGMMVGLMFLFSCSIYKPDKRLNNVDRILENEAGEQDFILNVVSDKVDKAVLLNSYPSLDRCKQHLESFASKKNLDFFEKYEVSKACCSYKGGKGKKKRNFNSHTCLIIKDFILYDDRVITNDNLSSFYSTQRVKIKK